MSLAKKAVDSTLKRIFNYTAEIIMSIILLIIICVPLVFAIPMWFQNVLFGVARPNLSVNPVLWFGLDGAVWITLLLVFVSFAISYVYILKMKPGQTSEVEESDSEETMDELEAEDIEDAIEEQIEEEEELALEDQEEEELADEDTPLEDQEEEPDEIEEDLAEDESEDE